MIAGWYSTLNLAPSRPKESQVLQIGLFLSEGAKGPHLMGPPSLWHCLDKAHLPECQEDVSVFVVNGICKIAEAERC